MTKYNAGLKLQHSVYNSVTLIINMPKWLGDGRAWVKSGTLLP